MLDWPCRMCGSPLERSDMTGLTYLWPDETPFDPQPEEWHCTNPECNFAYLRGLTREQADRLATLRLAISDLKAPSGREAPRA